MKHKPSIKGLNVKQLLEPGGVGKDGLVLVSAKRLTWHKNMEEKWKFASGIEKNYKKVQESWRGKTYRWVPGMGLSVAWAHTSLGSRLGGEGKGGGASFA